MYGELVMRQSNQRASWSKGMSEGPDTMAQRVIRSAQNDWKVDQRVVDYAKYMERIQGSTKFDGFLIQFDHLGDKNRTNHVRITPWKGK
jgi:hypothetical protein